MENTQIQRHCSMKIISKINQNSLKPFFTSVALLVYFHTVLRLVYLVSPSFGHLGRVTTLLLFVARLGTVLDGLAKWVEAVLTRFLPFSI